MKMQTFVVYWRYSGRPVADVEAATAQRAVSYAAKVLGVYESDLEAW
jgi:hypothetical protein